MKPRSKSKKNVSAPDRKRKFLLVVPILVLPFLTGVFWALGGGSGPTSPTGITEVQKGLNMSLPSPHFNKKETILDKLGFYQKAALDSARLMEREKNDPYLAAKPISESSRTPANLNGSLGRSSEGRLGSGTGASPDLNEEKVNKKLEELKKVINQPSFSSKDGYSNLAFPNNPETFKQSPDIERLGRLMRSLKQPADSSIHDSTMDRLNSMLDKVLKIQHPEMIADGKAKIPASIPEPRIVTPNKVIEGTIEILGGAPATDTAKNARNDPDDGFLTFDDNRDRQAGSDNTISAVISEDQTVVSGATVKLRLTEEANINGVTLAKDNFVYGTAALNNERLQIIIKTVLNGSSVVVVNWQVFDLDGMPGIYIPGAIGREVSKESAAEGINSVGITGLDASLGAQAATAGIQAAKTLFSKKIKLVRVSVKAGYEVLIKDNKNPS